MLQQTTIAAVTPYFERFITRFPDVAALAEAEQSEVLRYWEGLGYYSRARNLHAAANMIDDEFGGRFPSTREELCRLPGVGKYTASAVASFAFHRSVGVVEANTVRLYSRLLNMPQLPSSSAGQKILWSFADWAAGPGKAETLNQALMDLGAMVCTPQDPNCESCPVVPHCEAFQAGTQQQVPTARRRTPPTEVIEVCFAVTHKHRFLVRQNEEGERWSGLWDFPRVELTQTDWTEDREKQQGVTGNDWVPADELKSADVKRVVATASRVLLDKTGYLVGDVLMTTQMRHTVTRYRIRRICIVVRRQSGRLKRGANLKWFSLNELTDLPMSAPARKLTTWLLKHG